MIIDVHYHLEERMVTVEKLLAQMAQHSIDRVALIPTMIEPFELKGIAARAGAMLPGLLMGWLRGLGLVLYNSTVTADGQFSALGDKYAIYDTPDNESVADAMQAHPDKFYGWIFVNPRAAEPLAEIEKWAGKPGWIGVKSHPFWHRYPVASLDATAAYCAEKGWPLLAHIGSDRERGDFRYLPERHPNLKIIYAHAGIPFYRELWEYTKSKANVYVDLSNPVFVNALVLPEVVKALGVEKCLHGTDGPYAHANQGRMAKRIHQLPLTEAEKARILGGNFMEMIGG